MALEIVTPVLEPIVNYIIKPIGRQFGYLISYRKNMEELKTKMENLKALRNNVEQRKKEVENNLERVGDDVTTWLEKTDKILEDTIAILPSEADIEKGCLSQGLKSRYALSKRAKLMKDIVTQQKDDGSEYARFSHPLPPVDACIISEKDTVGDSLSRQNILADIMKALNDEEIHRIGICGPGGVGKTRIEKQVVAKVKEGNLYDRVVFTIFGKQFNLEKLQGSIAYQLGLQLKESDTNIRAKRLNERLKKENKLLLVLDDVWEKLNLEEIGLPEEHKGCKIILTSRSQDVCSSMLSKGGKIFTIELLCEGESWDLFKRNAGDCINDPALKQVARDIAKECGGLPLVILAIANALKDKNEDTWVDALAQLRKCIKKNITGLGEVYTRLMLTYELLDDEEAKKLHLHCCLFPEDFAIPLESLAREGMSLGLFEGIDTLKGARRRVGALIEKLQKCFLLEKGDDHRSVRMHDVVRDFAIDITSREHLFSVNHDLKLKHWPRDIDHGNVTCISVHSAKTVTHPETLNCPKLEYLELRTGDTSSLHDDIFQGTKALRTVELCTMTFSLLPSSIELLKNLRMLSLIQCKMEDISLIGELINLEILSLRYSTFDVFPAKLGKLKKLRLLDLSLCKALERIEPNTLSRFVELEELDMTYCEKVEWEVANKGEQRKNVSLTELEEMQNLTTLRVNVSDKAIPRDTSLPSKLEEYSICIAPSYEYQCFVSEYSKTIWCESDAEHGLNWIRTIVPSAKNFVLRKSVAKHVLDLLARSESTFQNVRSIDVRKCDELLYLANTADFINRWEASSQYDCFSNLERICLNDCDNMEHVYEEENHGGGHKVKFPRLEEIELESLKALKGFCNGTHNIELPSLSTLCLSKLPNIRGFFPNKDSYPTEPNQSAKENFLFRNEEALRSLKDLRLEWFDNSMLFCNQLVSHPSFKNLEFLFIEDCKNVPHCLFREVVSDDALSVKEEEERVIDNSLFPHLKVLHLMSLPDLRCVVSLNMQKVPFPNLKNLRVVFCERLLHFSSLSVARTSLQLVESISFYGCKEMEQVFVLEEDEPRCGNQSQIRDIRFPMLKELRLSYLPALTAFCKGINSIDFPNLRELWIEGLNNIKGFVTEDAEQSNDSGFLFGSKVSFGRLEELVLERLDSELWFHQLSSTYFRQLQSLRIWDCHKMRTYSSIGFLVNLKDLSIYSCSQIEVIIGEDEEGEGMNKKPLFPQLHNLDLKDLPKLRSFSQRNHDLHFPSLEEVEIRNCSEMQTFAQGYISTPKLRELKINGVLFPVNDINNSIRQHFNEKQVNATKIEEITSEEEVDEEVEKTSEEEANAKKIEVVAEEITSEEEMDEKIEIMEQVTEQITSEE